MPDHTTESVLFPGLISKPIVAAFDQAHGSSWIVNSSSVFSSTCKHLYDNQASDAGILTLFRGEFKLSRVRFCRP